VEQTAALTATASGTVALADLLGFTVPAQPSQIQEDDFILWVKVLRPELCGWLYNGTAVFSRLEAVAGRPKVAAKAALYNLTRGELLAVLLYTIDVDVLRVLNKALRDGDTATICYFQTFLIVLLCGLQKLPTYDGILFRVWTLLPMDEKLVAETWPVGKHIFLRGFSSCTPQLMQNQVDTFGTHLAKHGTIGAFFVRGARVIGDLSCFPHESEHVLLPCWSGTAVGYMDIHAKDILAVQWGVNIRTFAGIELCQDGEEVNGPIGFSSMAAAKAAQEQLASNPDDVAALNSLGNLLVNHFKHYVSARKHFEHAIWTNANHAESHRNLALLLQDHFMDYNGSRKHFEQAIRLDPNQAGHRYNLGLLLERHFKDHRGARKHYSDSIRIDPTPVALRSLGSLELHLLDYASARRHFEQAIHIDPNDAQTHCSLGRLLENHFHEYAGARKHYEEAIHIDPNDAQTHCSLGRLLVTHFHDSAGARKHYERAIHIDPNDVHVQYNLMSLNAR